MISEIHELVFIFAKITNQNCQKYIYGVSNKNCNNFFTLETDSTGRNTQPYCYQK